MKKKTFTNEQIGYALCQVEAGKTVAEICRELGVSQQTLYRWRHAYNQSRPHSSLGYLSPAEYLSIHEATETPGEPNF